MSAAAGARVFRGHFWMQADRGPSKIVFVELDEEEAEAFRAAMDARPDREGKIPVALSIGAAADVLAELHAAPPLPRSPSPRRRWR